jgi:Uma2 family endonuclease
MIAMSSEPLRRLSPADYLAFDRQAETKHEYVDGDVFAMTGASARHNVIVANLIIEIGSQLRGGPCRVFPSDLRLAVSAEGPFYYPDVTALCAEPRFLDDAHDTLLNPEVVIEVLSPSTRGFDRGTKLADYRRLPSVRDVLFVAQDAPRAEHYERRDDGHWLLTDHAGPEAAIELAAVGCRLALGRLYDKVDGLPVAGPAAR